MSNNENIGIKINNDSKRNLNKLSENKEMNPIVAQLEEFGYDSTYSRRLFYYLHPIDLDEALKYISIENGIIQHQFIPDRNISNNLCYICGNIQKMHLKELNINNNKNDRNEILSETSSNFSFNIKSMKNKNMERKHKNNININDEKKFELKEKEKIECKICNEVFEVNSTNKVEKCQHAFCPECWYDSLSVKIKENKLSSIKCLNYYCKEKLSDNFIINLLNSDINLINKYKRYKLELNIINDSNKKLCPFPNCDSFLELKNIFEKNVTCENNHIFCFECLKKPHGKLPCNNILEESMEEYSKNHLVKKCPKCSIITEKNLGCNHITCTKCGYQWCLLCNKEYKQNHFLEGKCRGFQNYQPKNNSEIKLVMEGKINPDELSNSQNQIIINNALDHNNEVYNPQKWYKNIIMIIFYFFFGFLYHIMKALKDIYYNKIHLVIYLLFYIAFFFQLIFLNVISFIIFFIISGFKISEMDYDNYIKRFILFFLYIYFVLFFFVYDLWPYLLVDIMGEKIYESLLFPFLSICTFISLFPYCIIFNTLLNLLLLMKRENIINEQFRKHFNFRLV